MCDRGVREKTVLEDMKKQLEKDFYKALGCPFMEC